MDLILSILGLRISNNVSVKATGEEASTELPEIVTKLQNTVRFFYMQSDSFIFNLMVESIGTIIGSSIASHFHLIHNI